MTNRGAVVCAFLTSLMATTVAHGADKAPPAPEPAVSGIGVALPPLSDRDRQKLTARAEAGDLDAMYELAHHALRSGDPVMGGPMYYWGSWNDPRESERWWRKAAALGDPKAMILLGHLYAEPWGVPQDIQEAASWFQKAAQKNNLEAIQDLIDLYLGAWSDERDDAAANVWLQRAAAMSDAHAMMILGLRYDAGWGIREDPVEAARWYMKVIERDGSEDDRRTQSIAWNNLGALYELGRGVPKNESKAAELYRKAAGYVPFSLPAMYNLASLCAEGRGVPQNRNAAIRLYLVVDWYGVPEAGQALARLGVQRLEIRSEKDLMGVQGIELVNKLARKGANACDF